MGGGLLKRNIPSWGVEWDGALPPLVKCTTPAPPGTHLGEPWTLCGEGRMIRSTNLSPPKLIPKLSFLRPPPLSREIRPGFTLEVCCVIVHSCHKSTQHRDTCPVWRAPNKPCALQKLQLVLAGNLTTPGKPGLPTDLWFFRLFLYLSLFKSLKRETSHFFLKLRQWHNVSTAGNFPLAQLW